MMNARRIVFVTAGIALHGTVMAQDVGGATPSGTQTCVQVEIAGQTGPAYNCLNRELQQQVQTAQGALAQIPLGAGSPDHAVGIFNRQGVAEQYGQNFGKSVIPYRPPGPVFNNPVH